MLGELISRKHQLTIADMEAGLEHLSRSDGTLRHVDVLLVVLEPYQKALETARRTFVVARQLGIPKIYGVANKVQADDDLEAARAFAESHGIPILAAVPFDPAARAADREGVALVDFAADSPAVTAIAELLDKIEGLAAAPAPNAPAEVR